MSVRLFKLKDDKKNNQYELLFKGFNSKETLDKYFEIKNSECFHLDYLLKKEIAKEKSGDSLYIFDLEKESDNGDIPIYKKRLSRNIRNIEENVFNNNHPINTYRKLCTSLNWVDDTLYMKVENSLIVGLGDSNVAETSMTIHNTYGIPYLPGQAIKGMFRSYFYTEIMTNPENEKVNGKVIDLKELYEFIFGDIIEKKDNQSNLKGNVIFFDAFPSQKCTICKDIMTPHYSKYYAGAVNVPMDIENPIPITFFVVKDTTFVIHFAIRKDLSIASENEEENYNVFTKEELSSFIKVTLQKALEEHGIGAKTAVGYGQMKYDVSEVNRLLEMKRKKQEEATIAVMSKLEKELHEIKKMSEEQKQSIVPNLINEIDKWEPNDQKIIAEYVKLYFENHKRWSIKNTEIDKPNKHAVKIIKICEILNIDLPLKGSN